MSTLHQFQERPAYTVAHMGRFIPGMFGNSVARGFPVADNLGFSRICGAIVLILALIGLAGQRPTADSTLRYIWHLLHRVTHHASLVMIFRSAGRSLLASIGFC
jgi:hypothetical protein